MIPTVGFNMRKVTKGSVVIKLWDLGGQPRFRSMWERYCRGVNAIVFVVDSADSQHFQAAKSELQQLLEKSQLRSIPILILGNKNDLEGALTVDQLIEEFDLKSIVDREAKAQQAKTAKPSGKNKKKKWSKGKVKDKANNAVVFDKATYDRMLKEVPTYKLVTPSVLVDRLRVNGSLARAAIKDLESKGLIRLVSAHGSQLIYTRSTKVSLKFCNRFLLNL
ncbi:hypothetical protein HDU92_001495 [Lobulomyces angularis]|nr:hypothetical protein HDU92_001495 [Lobulomyces angularis]